MAEPRPPETDPLRVRAEPLHAFVAAIRAQAGSSEREARLVADRLVGANLAGHDSHGIGTIPNYVASWLEGQLQLNRHAAIVRDADAVLDAWTQRCTECA